MPDDLEPDEAQYGLVMPFVVVTSKGGPWDDKAFVAGYRCANVDHALREKPITFDSYEYPALLPQLDLLAMHHGYTLTSEPWPDDPDGWAYVRFDRTDSVGKQGGGVDG